MENLIALIIVENLGVCQVEQAQTNTYFGHGRFVSFLAGPFPLLTDVLDRLAPLICLLLGTELPSDDGLCSIVTFGDGSKGFDENFKNTHFRTECRFLDMI